MMGKLKILIADDHFLIREGIRQMILGMDFIQADIVEVDNGASVVDYATKSHFDLILLDVRMPKIDGLKVLSLLRAQKVTTPILVISFFNEMVVLKRALSMGANGFITKDAVVEELEGAISMVLSGEKYVEPRLESDIAEQMNDIERKLGWENELTSRELELLKLIVREKSTKEIANEMNISTRTVEWHKDNLRNKMGVRSDVGLTKLAISYGIG